MNKNLDLAFAVKAPLKGLDDIATWTAGLGLSNFGKESGMKYAYGLQLDLNV